jgi:DNA-binding response OmpR family regulator
MGRKHIIPTENKKHKILIVDDESEICSALSNMLKLEGYIAQESTSGEQALALLQHNSFDVMILDMQMPGLSGVDVIHQARHLHPNLPIIILTGHATLDSAIAAAKSEQVIDYLLKPAKNQEIITAVAQALKKRAIQVRQKQLVEAASQVLNVINPSNLPLANTTTSEPPPPSSVPTKTTSNNHIHVAPLNLDRKHQLATVGNHPKHPIRLTKGETAVLATLMISHNQVLSCREIVLAVWGYETTEAEASSIVRPYISRLRRKIATVIDKPQLIRTVRECGYYFAPMKG